MEIPRRQRRPIAINVAATASGKPLRLEIPGPEPVGTDDSGSDPENECRESVLQKSGDDRVDSNHRR